MAMGIRTFGIAALLSMCALVSVAPGGAPMGPATAYLGEGQWGIGGEYGYGQADLTAAATVTEQYSGSSSVYWHQLLRVDNLAGHMAFGTLAYGVSDNWDIFARIGAGNATDQLSTVSASPTSVERHGDLDSSFGLAWGAGTRVTFCRAGPWSVGGLVQVTWFRPGNSDLSVTDPIPTDEAWVGQAKLHYWQAQASLAAALQLEKWQFWAGPFLQFVRGDLDFNGHGVLAGSNLSTLSWTSKVQEASQVGGHVGVNWQVSDQFNLWVEGQITADSWLVGIGGVIIPEKAFGI